MESHMDREYRRWNVREYYRLAEVGILRSAERVELINGRIVRKGTDGEPRRFTRRDYDRMVETGLLREDEKVELIAGELLLMSPEGARHAAVLGQALRLLMRAFGEDRYYVRPANPVAVEDDSQPEPDLAVVPNSPRNYVSAHPDGSTALLVVEVSQTSLAFDLGEKALLYARAGIREYWVLDLVTNRMHVHREPSAAAYRGVSQHAPPESIAPLAMPAAQFSIAELLLLED